MSTTPKVFAAIAAVSGELSKVGIAKDRYNEQQRFKFRGIDDFFNALSMPLAKHKLVIFPRYYDREVSSVETKSGSKMSVVSLKCDYTFVCADDGSSYTATVVSEAMDMADKATNKCMSASYKYMAAQVFCIPVEGLDDSDEDSPADAGNKSETPPPTVMLNKAQIAEIEDLLIQCDGESGAVTAGRKIIDHLTQNSEATWADIPASRFGSIVASIKKKIDAKGGAQ